MNSSLIKIRMRKCPKSIARTEVDLTMTFCDRQNRCHRMTLNWYDVVLLKIAVPRTDSYSLVLNRTSYSVPTGSA